MSYSKVDGGVTNAKGFKATGFSAGIKSSGDDMAIIYSELPCEVAGVFTKSTVKAAPLIWDMKLIENKEKIRAVVINSGNANACTGEKGLKDAKLMAEKTAEVYDIKSSEVMVSSTGIIGVNLPIEKITDGIENNYKKIDKTRKASNLAAKAIMTTDTYAKEIAVKLDLGGVEVNIGGIAKGSGMIHPNMGTMLGYITTDANISGELLRNALSESIVDSYNMISVDGDTSTNDTILLMANGLAENKMISEQNEEYRKFKEALDYVNKNLAKQIVKDGEGAGKFISVTVDGAKTKENARKLAKAIVTSSLVKTAFFGEDANWGRIISAMGSTEIEFNIEEMKMSFKSEAGDIVLMDKGTPLAFSEETGRKLLKEDEINVNIYLKDGKEIATAWGCDLSYKYIEINAEYRT